LIVIARPRNLSGFTLIELLVVITIILILIAIALPNFLESQIRAKVVRVESELRVLSIAVESYHGDRAVYPYMSVPSLDYTFLTDGFRWLTSPVAYLTTLPIDPFSQPVEPPNFAERGPNYKFHSTTPIPMAGLRRLSNVDAYFIFSYGPNWDPDSYTLTNAAWPFSLTENPCSIDRIPIWTYSPTNGTRSVGDIVRFGGEYRAGNWCLNGVRMIGRDFKVGRAWDGT
jgi:prepilin-type N-terminal cleavage/methylation domain-containing protein